METLNNVKESSEPTSLIDGFAWDENDSQFFSNGGDKNEPKEEPKSEVEEVIKDLKEGDEKKEEKKEPVIDFGSETPENTTEETETSYKSLYKKAKEKGLISIELEDEEDTEIDEEKFFEIQEAEIDARVDETFKGFFEELPEEGAAYLKFLKSGGNSKDFFEMMKNSTSTTVDITTERGQEAFLRNYLKTVEEKDEEDIDDDIERFKEKGTLAKYAEKYHSKEKEKTQEALKLAQKQAEERKKTLEENHQALVAELKTIISDKEDIKGWKLSKKDKKDLHSFMVRPNVKIGNNKYKTGFQDALQKAMADKEKLVLLAKILQSDFNIEEVQKQVQDKVAKETKAELNKKEQTPKKGNSGGSEKSKSLADYF